MKLIIRRNQADVKGLFGGHKGVCFSLYAKVVEITSEEQALIDRYKAGDYVLASYTWHYKNTPVEAIVSVDNLIKGKTIEVHNIQTLLDLEKEIKSSCINLKNLLLVMSTFGGIETIEI